MMADKVTRQQFAEWSFEQDRSINMYPRRMPWAELPEEEKTCYLEDADEHMSRPANAWPNYILKRLDA